MIFRPFYLGCLSHASYLVGSKGEAWVIDPQRDVEAYLEAAEAEGLRITGILETHFHADFVSGHPELARRTGATVYMGAQARPDFPCALLADGQVLRLGDLELRVLETPGHTPESLCLLVRDGADPEAPARLFTGDTLFIGDAGRPDLLGSVGRAPEEMAGLLYDSLHGKILPLPDETEIWPAHGAGSACGKNISSDRSAPLGQQRRFNPALQPMTREAFIAMATQGLSEPPAYFPAAVAMNRRGAPGLDELPPPPALDPAAFLARREAGARVLDVRSAEAYLQAHIPGALQVGLGGTFASWCGSFIPAQADILLVGAPEALAEARMRLARVGLDRVVGHLAGGMEAWIAAGLPCESVAALSPEELRGRADLRVLDVRNPGETASGHVPGAVCVPLAQLPVRLAEVPRGSLAVICAGGYRSLVACSLLEGAGFRDLHNVTGGTGAWVKAGLPVEVPTGV